MFLLTKMEDNFKIVTKIVPSSGHEEEPLKFYYENLHCQMIDIVNLTDDLVIICDDEGILVSNNPVFSILTNGGTEQQIAGNFLIAKSKVTNDGITTVPFNSLSEIERLSKVIKIGVVGVTK